MRRSLTSGWRATTRRCSARSARGRGVGACECGAGRRAAGVKRGGECPDGLGGGVRPPRGRPVVGKASERGGVPQFELRRQCRLGGRGLVRRRARRGFRIAQGGPCTQKKHGRHPLDCPHRFTLVSISNTLPEATRPKPWQNSKSPPPLSTEAVAKRDYGRDKPVPPPTVRPRVASRREKAGAAPGGVPPGKGGRGPGGPGRAGARAHWGGKKEKAGGVLLSHGRVPHYPRRRSP